MGGRGSTKPRISAQANISKSLQGMSLTGPVVQMAVQKAGFKSVSQARVAFIKLYNAKNSATIPQATKQALNRLPPEIRSQFLDAMQGVGGIGRGAASDIDKQLKRAKPEKTPKFVEPTGASLMRTMVKALGVATLGSKQLSLPTPQNLYRKLKPKKSDFLVPGMTSVERAKALKQYRKAADRARKKADKQAEQARNAVMYHKDFERLAKYVMFKQAETGKNVSLQQFSDVFGREPTKLSKKKLEKLLGYQQQLQAHRNWVPGARPESEKPKPLSKAARKALHQAGLLKHGPEKGGGPKTTTKKGKTLGQAVSKIDADVKQHNKKLGRKYKKAAKKHTKAKIQQIKLPSTKTMKLQIRLYDKKGNIIGLKDISSTDIENFGKYMGGELGNPNPFAFRPKRPKDIQ